MRRLPRTLLGLDRPLAGHQRLLLPVARRAARWRPRRSSRPPSSAPTAPSCTRSTPRRTARSSRSRRSRSTCATPSSPSRTSASTGTTAWTSAPCSARRCGPTPRPAGRLQGGSTITQQYVKQEILGNDDQTVSAQGPGGVDRRPARAALQQGPDPRAVPERDLLRERCLRHRGGRPPVLRQAHARPHHRARARSSPRSSSARAPPTPTSTRRRPRLAATRVLRRMQRNAFASADGRRGGAGHPAAAGISRRPRRRAVPRGVLRRGGEAVDPRRPPVRRHPQGAPRPALRRGPAHPDDRRPRHAGTGRAGGQRHPPGPERAGREPGVHRAHHGLRPGHGRRSGLLRHRSPRQAQPRHPGRALLGIVVQALRARPRRSRRGSTRTPPGSPPPSASPSRCPATTGTRATPSPAVPGPPPSPRAPSTPTTPSTPS